MQGCVNRDFNAKHYQKERNTIMKYVKQNASNIIVCLFEALVGILLLVNPVGFTAWILILFGAALIVAGILSIVRYFRTPAMEAALGQLLVKGLVLLVAGGFCALNFNWFLITFPLLSVVYGVGILLAGLSKIQWAVDLLRMRRKRWFLAIISAVISIVCAVVIVSNPFTSSAILWMFAGISLIVEAVFDAVALIAAGRNKEETV